MALPSFGAEEEEGSRPSPVSETVCDTEDALFEAQVVKDRAAAMRIYGPSGSKHHGNKRNMAVLQAV